MLDDLTPEKDGVLNVNLEDDVIRSATVCHRGKVTFPRLRLRFKRLANRKPL